MSSFTEGELAYLFESDASPASRRAGLRVWWVPLIGHLSNRQFERNQARLTVPARPPLSGEPGSAGAVPGRRG
jgi:hypothetical protein